jgi:DNA-binding transcriptional ArsR family regulator
VLVLCTETTKRVQAEAALRQSETRLRGVLDGTTEGFGLMGPDFTILEFNAEALRICRIVAPLAELTLPPLFEYRRNMEVTAAIDAFGALAQSTRLEAFRQLVRAGPDGLPAGTLARALATPANTLSTHLAILERAGLVTSRREGRLVYYAPAFTRVRALIGFLLDDCCAGAPEVCNAVAAMARDACCVAAE